MTRSDDLRVEDILKAVEDLSTIGERSKATFLSDRLLQLAAERLLEIIGEAASKMSQEFRDLHPNIEWSDIVGMRNVLAHAYHRVALEPVWEAITESAPRLADALRSTKS